MANRLAILIPGGRLLLATREIEGLGQRTFTGVVRVVAYPTRLIGSSF